MTGESPGETVRALMRASDRVALATASANAAGQPYASLALVACALDASPLLLLSSLAQHTRNIDHDARIALLYDGTSGLDDPLTGPRATVLGRVARSARTEDRSRFLARHPSANGYAGFSDFDMFRVAVDRAHLVAGFGRIHWCSAADVLFQGKTETLADSESDIVGHMNEDHADAIRLYATVLLARNDGDWRMTGIDPEGCDLRCGGNTARLTFARPVSSPAEAQAALVQLAREARNRPV